MGETSPYQELANALRERTSLIADRNFYERNPSGHLEQLKAVSDRIVSLQHQLPPPVDPQLAHFLQRCSYDKALAFLRENALSE